MWALFAQIWAHTLMASLVCSLPLVLFSPRAGAGEQRFEANKPLEVGIKKNYKEPPFLKWVSEFEKDSMGRLSEIEGELQAAINELRRKDFSPESQEKIEMAFDQQEDDLRALKRSMVSRLHDLKEQIHRRALEKNESYYQEKVKQLKTELLSAGRKLDQLIEAHRICLITPQDDPLCQGEGSRTAASQK